MDEQRHSASFRDPSGFIFEHEGVLYRQVEERYRSEYEHLMGSGLYEALSGKRWLIPHAEVAPPGGGAGGFRTLLPEPLDFVSYPYEWSFSQLRDAALLTLRIQRRALEFNMTLRDASAYNVQFQAGRPIFIDTLSFGHYQEGEPWVGYRQFCQHFLAPLALMSRRDIRLQQLLRSHLDGVPLDLAASLLPGRTWFNLGLLMHLRIHARYQQRYESTGSNTEAPPRAARVSRTALLNLVRGLENTISRLRWTPEGTEWADYYDGDSYEEPALAQKKQCVSRFLAAITPETVWDLGANTGVFSRIAAEAGARVCSFDIDPACVERNYRAVREERNRSLLPLLLDLTNPSPAIGWANRERGALADRANADAVLALALIHHLAISNNVPLAHVATFLGELGEHLIIEFVPKEDPKVRTLLATREDIFPDYTREGFERAFTERWHIVETLDIEGSTRTLYRMQRRR
jgi:hypothetical protein